MTRKTNPKAARKSTAKKPAAKKATARQSAKTHKAKRVAKPKAITVFAVQQFRVIPGECTIYGFPERVFAEKHDAEQYAAALSKQLRATHNPFSLVQPAFVVTGGERKMRAIVTKLGLTAPTAMEGSPYTDWGGWWDQLYYDMTDAQRDAIWDALDKLRLYTVVKTTLEE
jgi:hypothetical protein